MLRKIFHVFKGMKDRFDANMPWTTFLIGNEFIVYQWSRGQVDKVSNYTQPAPALTMQERRFESRSRQCQF